MNLEFFKSNFAGYALALIVVLIGYSAVEAIAPEYSQPLAIVTVAGIVLYYFRRR